MHARLVLLCLAGCAYGPLPLCPGGGTAPCDAGPLPDGGPDAPIDGRTEDAPDAPFDGGLDDPGWVPVPGESDGCVVEIAALPARLPPIVWDDCGAGCRRGRVPGPIWRAEGRFEDGRGVLVLWEDPPDVRQSLVSVVPGEDPAVFAIRAPASGASSCRLTVAATGEGAYAASAYYGGGVREARVVRGMIGGTPPALAATIEPQLLALAVSSELVAAASEAGSIFAVHDGVLVDVLVGSAAARGSAPSAAVDHLVFAEVGTDAHLAHWTPETGTEPYFDPPENVLEPRASGGELVWLRPREDVGGAATRTELWTAPFVRDPALLSPRLVHPDVGFVGAAFDDGTFGWTDASDGRVHVVDVATGGERVLDAPSGLDCGSPVYVSRAEVMLTCSEPGLPATRALYRFDTAVWARSI